MSSITSAPDKLTVGEPVARNDGRFYVPLSIENQTPGLSPIVTRIASDAFETLEGAQGFANELARRWNVPITITEGWFIRAKAWKKVDHKITDTQMDVYVGFERGMSDNGQPCWSEYGATYHRTREDAEADFAFWSKRASEMYGFKVIPETAEVLMKRTVTTKTETMLAADEADQISVASGQAPHHRRC